MAREIYKTVPLDDQLIPEVLRGSNFTNETSAHQFIITCTKNNEPVRLTGSVRGRFIAADNTSFLIEGSIVSGNAVVTLHQDCYHAPGRFQFVIFNTNGTENVAIYAAVGEVRRSDTNDLYITGEPLPDIDELLDAMGDLRDIIQDYDDIVLVQSEQPTSATNKIWIQPQADEYQVPTLQEHEDLAEEVADLKSALNTSVLNLPISSATMNVLVGGEDITDLPVGNYVCQTAGIAETITGFPSNITNKYAFRLIVFGAPSSNLLRVFWMKYKAGLYIKNGTYDWQYVSDTASLTTMVATLQADALATENGLSDITVGIESANSILPFYGEDGESVSGVSVTRKGHLITIDGTYTASARRRFNLFDITGGNATSTPPSWYATERTPLELGKTYKIQARSVGGSISIPTAGNYGLNLQGLDASANGVLYGYDYGNGDLVCAPMLSDGSGLACLMLTVNRNVVFDNYKLYIDVIEVPEQINIAYISSAAGSDLNDGSKTYPFKTLNKAVETGYKKLCVAPDVYNENISINGGEFELLPWVDGQTFDSSVPYRPKIELIYGTKLTISSAGNNIYTAPFTAASGTNMYKVFVSKTVSPTTQGSLALEYNAMLVGDKLNGTSGNNRKRLYTPVLTENELTNQGTFYYDGTTVKFHPWDDVLDDNYYIPNDDALIGLSLQNMRKVHLEDVRIIGCYDYCAYLQECDRVTINACEFAYSGKGMGLGLDNCNARVSDCHASACSADGFNLHKYGYSEFCDCTSFYNGDDGISHHQGCTGIIDGGEWAYNGSGGITPAFGCSVDVQNAYCHHNLIGLQFLGSSGNRRSLRCTGCLLTDNSQSDLYAKYYDITSWNCIYGVKEVGSYATIIEYNNKVIE